MNLVFDIAWIHVRSRVRQTGFAMAGVATGVGFSIMMASLMQGSQDDFIQRLVNTLPHVTVYDERRHPPAQPAESHGRRRDPAGGEFRHLQYRFDHHP
jgi:lipoprotein-releasing system permease protein